jgi:hypothetical protein
MLTMIPRPSSPFWSSSFGTDPVIARILLKSPICLSLPSNSLDGEQIERRGLSRTKEAPKERLS